ncbi:cysteine proteinase [Tothia fuscella]|uniref:ubiquitinyl hydrolase 1 n=1 Tax=Tothia fuscella TaxID=1048955 RepID=A0A9P4NXA7_9PEZI|nr:cysteine proteinase [Tothia fuscella]
MAAFAQDDDELARMQELSNKWESDATGPLVSERLASSAITTEYANADPVYQAKTASLPQKYAQYRTCRGDGHCGWRAVAFGYFETLMRIGDSQKFREEETRLKSMCNILNAAGHQEHLYEDFADDTIELLRETASASDGGAALLQTFNDSNRSMSIITYLKLLTSAWIQKHPDLYQPFINQPVQSYCRSHIEPSVCEIEHVGMNALVDVLVKPAGIAVEILYLDRTPGDEVNTYRFDPVDHHNEPLPAPPTLRLLYRPGHYDILYKLEDLPQQAALPFNPAPQNVFVALNHTSTETTHHKIAFELDNIEIPGMSFYPGPNMGWSNFPQYDFSPVSVPYPHSSSRSLPTPSYAPVPVAHAPEYYTTSVTVPPPSVAPVTLPHHPAPHAPIDRVGPFRPSIWEYETNFAPAAPHLPLCQTAIFRNSHYNTAHFNNPDFEPEQWQPDSEYGHTERPRKKSSHS